MKRPTIGEAILSAAVILALGAVIRQRAQMGELVASATEFMEERDKLKIHLLHLSHFHRATAAATGSPFIEGLDIVGDTLIRHERPQDGLYYSIQVQCYACTRNFEFLRGLYRESKSTGDFGVFFLAFDDSSHVLRDYARTHTLEMPLVYGPKGAVADFFPRYGTPFGVVVMDGCVASTVAGVFTPAEERGFLAAARRRRAEGHLAPETMRPLESC